MIGLAELGPVPPPPGDWVQQLAAAFRLATRGKPRSGREVVALVRSAARLEAGEMLPRGVWMQGMLDEVAAGWGLRVGPL